MFSKDCFQIETCCVLQMILFCKSYYNQLKSMEQKQSQIGANQAAELSLLQFINQSYQNLQHIDKVEKTIFLYYVYQLKEENQEKNSDKKTQKNILSNMNTFAHYILNNNLVVQVKKSSKRPSYDLPSGVKQTSEQQLKHKRYKIQQASQYDIHSYQTNNLRVVVLPVEKQLLDLKSRNQNKQIEQEQKTRHDQFFIAQKKNQTPENRTKLKEINKKYFDERVKKAYKYHIQTYRNEDLVSHFLEKTQKVSIVNILQYKDKIEKAAKKSLEQFNSIFISQSKQGQPRLLVYYSKKDESDSDDQSGSLEKFLNQSNCAALFTHKQFQDKNVLKVVKDTVLNDKYFFKKSLVKLNFYNNLKNAESNPIHQVMRQFLDNLRSIAIKTVEVIPSLFKNIYKTLGPDSTIYKKQYLTFKKINEIYKINRLNLPTLSLLGEYFTKKNLGLIKKDNSNQSSQDQVVEVPSSLNNLVFVNSFNKIKEDALKADFESRFEIDKRLANWKQVFKNFFDLILSLFTRIKQLKQRNPTSKAPQSKVLSSEKSIQIQYDNTITSQSKVSSSEKNIQIQQNNSLVNLEIYEEMQGYYDFLCFLFKYIEKFNDSLGEGAQFVDQFKAMLTSLAISQEKIIKYIIEHQQNIRSKQQLIYYDLYQLLINQNKGNSTKDKLDYIQCHILQLKAYEIASNYIYDEERIVEAIKAYAQVALKYKQLPQTKKKLINILQIQIKMARLLNILGQQEQAAKIFFELKMFGEAHRIFSQLSWNFMGDSKSKKLIEWGNKFENEFQYQIALQFYRNAFDAAQQEERKIQALKNRKNCLIRRRREETEEEVRAIDKFITKGDIFGYTNQPQLEKIFLRMEKLKWSNEDEFASFL